MFQGTNVEYSSHAEGTWGDFTTPSGSVRYVLTNARLGLDATDPERRLTKMLRPVRELLDVSDLKFSEILQRNLDDHRVSSELVRYVLEPTQSGPSFFPPILAVLLPFEGGHPLDAFPPRGSVDARQLNVHGGLRLAGLQRGHAMAFDYLVDDHDSPHPLRYGRLSWNEEATKLVVLDGQHRAMALLAIDRTLREAWGEAGRGARYRHFYEEPVARLLEEYGESAIEDLRFPVAILWIEGDSPQVAARKIFVDVNQQARRPSESRLILLSDTELRNILARNLMERLREPSPPLPLQAVEYDNPSSSSARSSKWTAVTNIQILRRAVEFVAFGPERRITDLGWWPAGAVSAGEQDRFFRKTLALRNFLPAEFEDPQDGQLYKRDEIGNTNFPPSHLPRLVSEFVDGWGAAILALLGGVSPYAIHCSALNEFSQAWDVDDDQPGVLAKEALLEGSGLYFTLKSAHDHYRGLDDNQHGEPDAVRAWKAVEDRRASFCRMRANELLGLSSGASAEQTAVVDDLYRTLTTYACELGLVLAAASAIHRASKDPADLSGTVANLIDAWNSALGVATPDGSRNLLLMFRANETNSFNRLERLNTSYARYFRYFWLQLLSTETAKQILETRFNLEIMEQLTAEAKKPYYNRLRKQARTAAHNEGIVGDDLDDESERRARESLQAALESWFGEQPTRLDPNRSSDEAYGDEEGDSATDDIDEGDDPSEEFNDA